MTNLIDLDYIEYYSDSGREYTGLSLYNIYRCKTNDGQGISSYGVGEWCRLYTLGVI